jgi:phage host-nuclease inhibitor protein Gam
MARKHIVEVPALKSWEEVDKALREIAENQIALQDIESEMQRQIIGVKKIAEQDSKRYNDRIAKVERDIKEFVEDHRDELGKAKTKALNFGEVGYRLSTSISIPKAKEKIADIIRKFKARGMNDCIIVKEDISRENLKKYGEDTVNAVGATWKQKDTFGYDIYIDKLERIIASGD